MNWWIEVIFSMQMIVLQVFRWSCPIGDGQLQLYLFLLFLYKVFLDNVRNNLQYNAFLS